MNIIYLPSSTTPKQWGRGNFLKNTGPFPQKWKNPVMVTLNFPTLVKYTFHMRWFMIFTDRCPLPSLGGEDLPKRHSPLLLYFTKKSPNTQPTKNNWKGDEDITSSCLCLWLLYSDSCLCKSWCHRCCPKGQKSMLYCCIANKVDLMYIVSLLDETYHKYIQSLS